MPKLESFGTFRARITDHGVGKNEKSGFPYFVADLLITEKYVEEKKEIEHFIGQGVLPADSGPAWVHWEPFGDTTRGWFTLFKDADVFSDDTALLNCAQVEKAVGWDGTDFGTLAGGVHVGKIVLIRVEASTNPQYAGQPQVSWIDHKDASPVRELRQLDAAALSGLTAKIQRKGKGAGAVKPAIARPAAAPTPAPAAAAAPPPQAPAAPVAPPPPASQPAAPPQTAATRPPTPTKGEAWNYLLSVRGGNTVPQVTDAWIAACEEVGGSRPDTEFTAEEWDSIVEIVARDMALV